MEKPLSTRQMWKRLAKVEELIRPKRDDGQYTLEELCRALWRQDENGYRKIVDREASSLGFFTIRARRFGAGPSVTEAEISMTTIDRRIRKLEDRFWIGDKRQ